MTVSHHTWTPGDAAPPPAAADLVFAFGPTRLLADEAVFDSVRRCYPAARIVGASTGGQIRNGSVSDDALVLAAVAFESTGVDVSRVALDDGESDEALGRRLAAQIAQIDAEGRRLAHVFVLTDGLALNGSMFAAGIEGALPGGVGVTGGLAADDDRFERTPLWADGCLTDPSALAVAFYGDALRVGVGAVGGWDTFGIERRVTKATGNVLEELDGRPALALYEQYLGPYAADLPGSGLLFPLGIRSDDTDYDLVRSMLGIDREAGTITFAGDVPEGATAKLMRTNPDRLVDGAHAAAQQAVRALGVPAQLALLVSCVGRKWAMGERVDEEAEETADVLGGVPAIGFYSYGELAAAADGSRCELHNQTMAITAFAEV